MRFIIAFCRVTLNGEEELTSPLAENRVYTVHGWSLFLLGFSSSLPFLYSMHVSSVCCWLSDGCQCQNSLQLNLLKSNSEVYSNNKLTLFQLKQNNIENIYICHCARVK